MYVSFFYDDKYFSESDPKKVLYKTFIKAV